MTTPESRAAQARWAVNNMPPGLDVHSYVAGVWACTRVAIEQLEESVTITENEPLSGANAIEHALKWAQWAVDRAEYLRDEMEQDPDPQTAALIAGALALIASVLSA